MIKEEKIDTLDRKIAESTHYLNELKALEQKHGNLVRVKVLNGYALCTEHYAKAIKANQR